MTTVPDALLQVINDAVLRRLADAETYQRGLDYFSHGHVQSWESRDKGVHALVRGTRTYSIELVTDEGFLDYSCDCRVGAQGVFCKHCVAVGLALLNRAATKIPKPTIRGERKDVTLADAAKFLASEDKKTLVEMVLAWAKDDNRLRERLLLYAGRRSGPKAGLAAAHRAFQKAVRVRGFVDYREAARWARNVDQAIDAIEQLLNDGQAGAVIELCESALSSLSIAIESVDDSDGHFSMLRDRLQELHFAACREAPPDPEELAGRLFKWELNSGWDVFHGAVSQYQSMLGTKGLKAYEALAAREWEKVPHRTAKSKSSDDEDYFAITSIMESLARSSGDVEKVVAVMERQLSHAYDYLRIAEAYAASGRHEQALQWAEKGLREFPNQTDSRLREFVSEEYQRLDRHDEAMRIIWTEFKERPTLESYRILAKHAKRAGAWEKWREEAFAEIRAGIKRSKTSSRVLGRSRWMRPEGEHSLLVEILLHEKKPDDAWREAQSGGCSERLWLRLADFRDRDHPEDAAPIYLKIAEDLVQPTNNGRYEDAVGLLKKAATTMRRIDQGADFARRLEALRSKYKIKRNFLKLLEAERKSLFAD